MSEVEMKDEPSEWVKIKSDEGFTFIVPRKAALISGLLRGMLNPEINFSEARSNTCQLRLRPVVTEKVLEYLVHKAQYEKVGPKEEIPDFSERIVPELALEMLIAADYLDGAYRPSESYDVIV